MVAYALNNGDNFFVSPSAGQFPGQPQLWNDVIWGFGGDDTIYGDQGNDVVFGGTGRDVLFGGAGADQLLGQSGGDVLVGGTGGDILNGGAGIDRAAYNQATSGLTADLQNAAANTGEAAGDTYVSIENMSGSAFGDNLRGDSGSNTIWGVNGNDWIHGRGGSDVLNGGNGHDRLYGGGGGDNVGGGNGNDRLYGQSGYDRLRGDAGNDRLSGGHGSDSLEGGTGLDTLFGGNGHDTLLGGSQGDSLNGGSGNDRLIGGTSRDTLDGGAGDDVFVFNSTSESTGVGADIIQGFDAPGSWIAAGPGDIDTDRVDVRSIDANVLLRGNQSFEFLGEVSAAEAFAQGPGVLWLENTGGETNVYGNVDNDAFAELRIRIQDGNTDAGTYNAGDFIGVTDFIL